MKGGPINTQKDRILFHDVINHTHGINLFLETKISSGQSITVAEAAALQQEIYILQNIIKDHFGLYHRSLLPSDKIIVNFAQAKEIIDRMMQNYFAQSCCQVTQFCQVEVPEKIRLHLPSFYRIMNNLIKNAQEAQSTSLQVEYEQREAYLHIQVASCPGPGAKTAAGKGLGLESVAYLVGRQQGTFFQDSVNGQWLVKIIIPLVSDESGQGQEVA